MQARARTIWATVLAIGVTATFTPNAQGSGYHPQFDEAVAEAKIIVSGQVTKAWEPRSKANSHSQWHLVGEVYRMRVTDVFKGNVKAGDDIVFWDPYSGSTAGYFVTEGKPNLTFRCFGN